MNKLQQFSNLSSWREDKITVKAGSVETLTFIDTKPNMFYIMNPNDCKLRVSINKYPTEKSYEFTVDANTSGTMGRPTATGYLYILNTGVTEANISVFSVYDEFDMNILRNLSVKVDSAKFESDGIVRGFSQGVSLPVGNNVIGEVILPQYCTDRLSNIDNALLDIYSKELDILDMNTNIFTRQADIQTDIQTVNTTVTHVENSVSDIHNLLNQSLPNLEAYLSEIAHGTADPTTVVPVYHNNVVSFSRTVLDDCKIHFVWLMYDGGTTANVEIDGTVQLTIMADEKFSNMEFELKAGQTITLTSSQPMYRLKYYIY